MNSPNQLTVARFVMAFIFVALMTFHHLAAYLLAYAFFVAAALTDYYDGKIARKRNLITNFGKLLDPVADKVLLVGALIMLMDMPMLNVPGWTIVVILAREFLITGVRSLAATGGNVIAANTWGKTKAVLQMVYVLVFMGLAMIGEILRYFAQSADSMPAVIDTFERWVSIASLWAIVGVALLTLYSGVYFLQVNWRSLGIGEET